LNFWIFVFLDFCIFLFWIFVYAKIYFASFICYIKKITQTRIWTPTSYIHRQAP
jgi:hypothetical protein